MIKIKSKREIEIMREAGRILALTRNMLKENIKEGITTKQLDILAEKFIISNNAYPSFKGYNGFPGSICTSLNEVVVHGIPSSKDKLKNGDIITIDIGVYYKGYHADSAYTYAVGNISEEEKQLLEITQNSLYKGLEAAKAGNYVSDISRAIENYIKPFKYGIVEEFTGHGIGKDLHEEPMVPNYVSLKHDVMLKEGMTICVEPMINLGTKHVGILDDNWTTVTVDKSKSAHFEHMIVITKTGYEILTKLQGEK